MDKHLTLLLSIVLCYTMSADAQESTAAPDQKAERRSFNALNLPNTNGYFNKFSKFNDILPTKQGPVLFPNDAPPPPRPPLVVTARPLFEQIARSELNPLPRTRNQTEDNLNLLRLLTGQSPSPGDFSLKSSQLHRPYSGALRSNDPYGDIDLNSSYGEARNLTAESANFLKLLNSPSPATSVNALASNRINLKQTYADLLKSYPDTGDDGYRIYEHQSTPLPALYKAISQKAHQKAAKATQESQNQYQQTNDYDGNGLVGGGGAKVEYGDNSDEGANYAFSYAVKDGDTGDDFSHSQRSSGQATSGEYRVRLPDGRLQVVSYTADEGGYQAQVRYDDAHAEQREQGAKDDARFKTDYAGYGGDYSTEYSDPIPKPRPTFHTSVIPKTKTHSDLGRIIVPSKDYDYSIETYNKNSVSTTNNYNDLDAILITPTKPSFKNSYNVASTPSSFEYNNLYTATPKSTAYNNYLSGYLNSKYSYASPKVTPVYEQYTVAPNYYKNTFSPSVSSNYLVTKDYLNGYQKSTPKTPSLDYSSLDDYSGDNLNKNNGFSGYGLNNLGKTVDYGGKFNKYLGYK